MLQSNLFDVQKQSLAKGHLLSGFAYFLEMGLGKTRLMLYDSYYHMKAGRVDVTVILCPMSLRGTWAIEAEEVEFPYPVIPMVGTAQQVWKQIEDCKGPCVVVIHYDIVLTRGGDLIDLLLEKGKKVMLGIDESTRIKNPKSKVAKYLLSIKDKFKYIRLMSGSPAPQGPHDLWTQFSLIGATKDKYFSWRNTYCVMGGWQGKQVKGSQNLDILRARTDAWVFRAKKNGINPVTGLPWTDLPPQLSAKPREIEMTPIQREAYLRMMHDFVLEWGDQEITAKMAVTSKTKLAQIGSGFLYNNAGETVHLFEEGQKNPKIEEMMRYLEEIEGKALIFYHFQPSFHLIKNALEGAGYKVVYLPSGLKEDEVELRKALFNEDDEYTVGVMQSSSYKYGHTMLGTEKVPCFNSLFFENNYDAEVRIQCEARNHRHGQRFPTVYTDISISREDTKVILALQRKFGLQEAILSEFSAR